MIKRYLPYGAIITLALITGALTAIPQVIAEHRLPTYAGIHKEVNDDQLYYETRAREVIEGHTLLGNPYLFEHKSEPPMQVWVTDAILAYGSHFLIGDLHTGSIVWDFVWPAIIVLLTFCFLFLLTDEWLLSIGITTYLSIGLYLVALNRSPSPQFNFVFFLLFLITLLQALLTRKRLHILFAALTFGALFWIYTYYWTYAVILLGLLGVGYFIFFRGNKLHWIIAWVFGGGIIIGLPYLWSTWHISSLPYYTETLMRVGLIYTHSPSGILIVGYAGCITLAYLILWWFRILPFTERSLFAFVAVFAGVVAVNQHIITGINLEFSSHYHIVSMYADIFACALIVQALLARVTRYRSYALAALLIVIAFMSFTTAYKVVTDQATLSPEFIANQRYAPLLGWLQSNTKKDDVVFANNTISYLIPAYTHDNVFYRIEAVLYFVPQSEIRARFLAFHYFDSSFTRQTFTSSGIATERQIYGNYYIERAAHLASLNQMRHWIGLSPITIERYPEADLSSLFEEWHAMEVKSFREAVAPYRVDYLVWDQKENPDWNVKKIPGLQKVYNNDEITVYKL
jgi:hypothetical protein